MSQPQDVVRGHAFDGIEEFDNRLPNWWLWSLYLACIFSVVYWIHYHVLRTGPSALDDFRADMSVFAKEKADREAREALSAVSDESLEAMAKDPAVVEAGKQIFLLQCFSCHKADGGGLIGPNLTDKYWIHGGRPAEIYALIVKGVVEKGMLAWGSVIGKTKCQQVAAYVLTLRNTNVAGGKAPEGEARD